MGFRRILFLGVSRELSLPHGALGEIASQVLKLDDVFPHLLHVLEFRISSEFPALINDLDVAFREVPAGPEEQPSEDLFVAFSSCCN